VKLTSMNFEALVVHRQPGDAGGGGGGGGGGAPQSGADPKGGAGGAPPSRERLAALQADIKVGWCRLTRGNPR